MGKNFTLLLLVSIFVFGLTFLSFKDSKPNTNQNNSNNEISSCSAMDLTGSIDWNDTNAFFEGEDVSVPRLALVDTPLKVLGSEGGEKWIEVDLSEQKLVAREGDKVFLETRISSGLPRTPTPKGEFRIWIKLRATKMSGGSGRGYYYLPNVPYVMFFSNDSIPSWKGYGLHGTYWHNAFGTPRSHGCVNLPTERAKELYYWVAPSLTEGRSSVRASAENPGTRIVIHE